MTPSNDQLTGSRSFTSPDTHPFDAVAWEVRDAVILGKDGQTVFEARGVEFPTDWSQRATDIVASKYFRVVNGERETSVRQMINRVCDTIAGWGNLDGYFGTHDEYYTFHHELAHILLHQMAAFNSPVWFNVGVAEKPQTSACYILDVDDSMESILEWYRQEALIFKGGSGAGVNVSKIREKGAGLSNGGMASGPVSFMRGADTNAGTIKSGGGTRRAAKAVILDAAHPDIREFIQCKVKAERMARTLAQAGFTDGLEDEVREYVPFQNANNSVSVTDIFMSKCADSALPHQQSCLSSRLLQEIAKAAWECGDPGLFFHSTVNRWHTTPSRGAIVSCNPCFEFMRPPNEACNLASINLLKFLKDDGSFDIPAFTHTVDILITAMDILIDRSSYPTEQIAENSRNYRPLGLGYANLGALLMAKGLPYDSDEGRSYAASVTALMTGEAYAQSARLAEVKGAFAVYEGADRRAMGEVVNKHYEAIQDVGVQQLSTDTAEVWRHAMATWMHLGDINTETGFRNCQVSVLAPTGTISFMMDCDTTGIEPAIGLVTYKKLVGGGTLQMVNGVVHRALKALGYEDHETENICAGIYDGKLFTRTEHDPVFATALGDNAISWQGHVKMVAAVQPFISGGVSKTINMPSTSTVQDIYDAYVMAWQLGLKAVAVYRDGCKNVQPVTVKQDATQQIVQVTERALCPSCRKADAIVQTSVGIWNDYLMCRFCRFMPVYATREEAYAVRLKAQAAVNTEMPEYLLIRPEQEERARKVLDDFYENGTALTDQEAADLEATLRPSAQRTRLPDERQSITHKFSIDGQEGYLHVGLYPDGQPGELFIKVAKEGSTVSGLVDTIGILTSLLLQHGVPLKTLTDKLVGVQFEPAGMTGNPEILFAKSLVDYVFKWMAEKFGNSYSALRAAGLGPLEAAEAQYPGITGRRVELDAPVCPECGSLMLRRTGSCFVCDSCGSASGCS